jgi:YhgE/Pip-like protein
MFGWQLQTQRPFYRSPIAAFVMIAVVLLGLALVVLSQPVQQPQRLQVAVVNADQTATIAGKKQVLGDSISARLQDSTAFKAVASTQQKAQNGLGNGQYAAIITIPKNFSQTISQYAKTGKGAQLAVRYNSAHNPWQTGIVQQTLQPVLDDLNAQLLSSGNNREGLQKSVQNSTQSVTDAKTLQSGIAAIADQIPTNEQLRNITSTTRDYGHELADLSTQMNAAVASGNQAEISAIAVEMQTIAYQLQTTELANVNTLVSHLETIGQAAQRDGELQRAARDIVTANEEIAGTLGGQTGDLTPSAEATSIDRLVTLVEQDTAKSSARAGLQIMPVLIAGTMALVALALVIWRQLRVSELTDRHVLEQWWGHFQVFAPLVGIVGVLGWAVTALLQPMPHDWQALGLLLAITLLGGWVLVSLNWLLRLLLGQLGSVVAGILLVLQVLLSGAFVPLTYFGTFGAVIAQALPFTQMMLGMRQALSGIDATNAALILFIWLVVLTAALVTIYRLEQKGRTMQFWPRPIENNA